MKSNFADPDRDQPIITIPYLTPTHIPVDTDAPNILTIPKKPATLITVQFFLINRVIHRVADITESVLKLVKIPQNRPVQSTILWYQHQTNKTEW